MHLLTMNPTRAPIPDLPQTPVLCGTGKVRKLPFHILYCTAVPNTQVGLCIHVAAKAPEQCKHHLKYVGSSASQCRERLNPGSKQKIMNGGLTAAYPPHFMCAVLLLFNIPRLTHLPKLKKTWNNWRNTSQASISGGRSDTEGETETVRQERKPQKL